MRDRFELGVLTLLASISALITTMFFVTNHKLKEEAVKRGFAEWVVSSNETVKWAWKEVAK